MGAFSDPYSLVLMQVILGPFHPHLENALADEILGYRKTDLLCPLMVLVPSVSLRRRIKVLLTNEHRLSFLNLHILTFHQLSLRLFEEAHGTNGLSLRDDAFLEEVLRQIIRMGQPGTSAFSGIDERVRGCAALEQTLRDLKDGMVELSPTIEALNEGHFGRQNREKISELFVLFDTFLTCCKERRIRDYSDLDIQVIEQVHSSEFLKQFRQIFYYGFYDLTQVQVDLFRSIARNYPTTLFFPLVRGHPGWVFAERFYERHVQGLAGDVSQTVNLAGGSKTGRLASHPGILPLFADEPYRRDDPVPGNLRCTFLSCFGARDEVTTVAKEILRLVSDEGIAFGEIGVVARDLEAYVPWIKEAFTEHGIPITTTAQEPLVQFPMVKAVLLLITLASRDYLRSHLVDLVSSPFFNIRSFCPDGLTPRPDLWDLFTRRMGITKGLSGWRRLERHLNRDLILTEAEYENEALRTLTVSASQVRILWDLFTNLYEDLESLPREASWSQYVSAWKGLLQKYLEISNGTKTQGPSQEDQVRAEVLNTLERLVGLDVINTKISLVHFIQTYRRLLDRSSIPLSDWNVDGVAVEDVMTTRGVPFRVLFILGLNEGTFPRTIREDAFLRDRHRRVLETVLGYKVSEKLAAFDEEKLLFTLLVGAARERLYCLYQRSDESGRALIPSWYLGELRRSLGKGEASSLLRETVVPRGITEKRQIEPFNRHELLLPQELAVWLSLESRDPLPLIERFSDSGNIYRRGHLAIESLEDTGGSLAEYDGTVGLLPEFWNRLRDRGVSPSALERYALCPFQFYARNILRLGRLDRPEEITGLSPSDTGELAHLILKLFYQELIDRGYFASNESPLDVQRTLAACAQRVFSEFESERPVGYRLAWEISQEALTELLGQVVERDCKELFQSGYRPLAVEIEAKGQLEDRWPAPLKGLSIHGRMDRIDYLADKNRYRVIDYKYKSGPSRSTEDNNLSRSALRGQRLQPPFYLLLGKRFATQHNKGAADPTIEAAFYFLAPDWPKGPLVSETFPPEGWDGSLGSGLKETLSLLLKGIQQGQFFIHPGSHCEHCEVSELCRKNHLPSRWRADNDPRTQSFRKLRQKNLKKEEVDREKKPRQTKGKET
ncbi:MAG: exodeoxyribonuclease V subunit gamma [Deltaproteobacteria bacterium]|nr:exodeoxyribonuclease V subunit gamma [Deltaproteobacteria bacterium]